MRQRVEAVNYILQLIQYVGVLQFIKQLPGILIPSTQRQFKDITVEKQGQYRTRGTPGGGRVLVRDMPGLGSNRKNREKHCYQNQDEQNNGKSPHIPDEQHLYQYIQDG